MQSLLLVILVSLTTLQYILGKWQPSVSLSLSTCWGLTNYILRVRGQARSPPSSPQGLGGSGPEEGLGPVQNPGEPGEVAASFWN